MPFIDWLVNPIMTLAAVIAGWFVAEDAASFGVVQMAVAVLLFVAIVAVLTFWRQLLWWRPSRGK